MKLLVVCPLALVSVLSAQETPEPDHVWGRVLDSELRPVRGARVDVERRGEALVSVPIPTGGVRTDGVGRLVARSPLYSGQGLAISADSAPRLLWLPPGDFELRVHRAAPPDLPGAFSNASGVEHVDRGARGCRLGGRRDGAAIVIHAMARRAAAPARP